MSRYCVCVGIFPSQRREEILHKVQCLTTSVLLYILQILKLIMQIKSQGKWQEANQVYRQV